MRLSRLQKYILLECFAQRGKCNRKNLLQFYKKQKEKPKKDDQVNSITKSIERLITKELLVGYGSKTAQKWFINEIRLTTLGRRITRGLLGKQQQLPFSKKKSHKKIIN